MLSSEWKEKVVTEVENLYVEGIAFNKEAVGVA